MTQKGKKEALMTEHPNSNVQLLPKQDQEKEKLV